MRRFVLVLAALALEAASAAKFRGGRAYNTRIPKDPVRASLEDGKITVHLVTHTHDDVGWLKTVDQYYMGSNNSIQEAAVQYILDTTKDQLVANPDRRFTYIEQGFFQRWWRELDSEDRATVKGLFESGQLEFDNGGWCMHDEAATHYQAMIDQTTLGHDFLLQEFGAVPKVGWQIDPFGHSATQAALLSAEVGFDALYFWRIDYQDKANRINKTTLEMLWRASPSLGASAQVFTGAFHGSYGTPISQLSFEVLFSQGQIQDDPNLEDYNVDYYVDSFVQAAQAWAAQNAPGQNQVMFLMGMDFNYRSAREWFKNMDKLIHYVNLDGRVQTQYSTPQTYTEAVFAQNLTWTVKTDDFFPYADCPDCYWTGYFTSRPSEKGYTRVGSNYLRAAAIADGLSGGNGQGIELLKESMGIAQHHDSVSGTAKQHVAFDYYKRIAGGIANASATLHGNLATLETANAANAASLASVMVECTRLNESACTFTTSQNDYDVTVYNWLGRSRTEFVRLPLPAGATPTVYDASGAVVASQVVTNQPIPFVTDGAASSVVFPVSLPPVGVSVYRVTTSSGSSSSSSPSSSTSSSSSSSAPAVGATQTASNGIITLTYDSTTGRLVSMANAASGVTSAMTQEWLWYAGYGTDQGQNSGAYIFRPNSTAAYPVATGPVSLTITPGTQVTEVVQKFGSWITTTSRLYAGADFVEVESTVGPIPIDDGWGKEIITRWSSDIVSASTWYTDSNGREFQKRVRNYRPTWTLNVTQPISGNYYPVNTALFLNDSARQLTVLTDRSQGGSSILDGSLELMVHRRLLWDDSRGVGEPLNETSIAQYFPFFQRQGNPLVVRTVHHVRLDAPGSAMKNVRPLMDRVFAAPVVAFTPASARSLVAHRTATLAAPSLNLPINVHLSNADARFDGSLLVRVSHQFAVNEDPTYSQPAVVDLSALFARTIQTVTEVTLTGNQKASVARRKAWHAVDMPASAMKTALVEDPVEYENDGTNAPIPVTLTPMKIRTFLVTFA